MGCGEVEVRWMCMVRIVGWDVVRLRCGGCEMQSDKDMKGRRRSALVECGG